MTSLESWIAVLALALGTFAIRYSFIGLFAKRDMPAWLEHGLKLVVPAIFAAIVAGGLFFSGGQWAGWAGWPRYAAACVALCVALLTRGNVLVTVGSGMLSLHAFIALSRY